MERVTTYEQFVNEKREDVGKYNTVQKVISKLGRRPSEQDLATFINNNYYDVTGEDQEEDIPSANDKIADLVGFYKFDIEDWEIAWADAQNESVVTEATSINDPVLMAFRAARMQRERELAKPKRKPLYGKQRVKAEDDLWDISQDLKDLYSDRGQMLIDMEQEAEAEGGQIADEYGSELNKIEKDIQMLIAKRSKLEIMLAESVSLVTERDTLSELNDMTLGQLERIEDYAEMIADRMESGQQLDSWMFSQITVSLDNLNAVHDAMDGEDGIEESKVTEEDDDNPCWKGYEMFGMKTKDGREVPNCIPKNESVVTEAFKSSYVTKQGSGYAVARFLDKPTSQRAIDSLVKDLRKKQKEVLGKDPGGGFSMDLDTIYSGSFSKEEAEELLKSLNESVVTEGKRRLSFKDADITSTMDLSKAMDALKVADISWDQKGQSFTFDSPEDLKTAKEVLELN